MTSKQVQPNTESGAVWRETEKSVKCYGACSGTPVHGVCMPVQVN
jgi:hypothetical protein